MSDKNQDELAEAKTEDGEDYYSAENVEARRKASGIEFIAHDYLPEPGTVKRGSEERKDVYVGREGELKTLRAELTDDDGEVLNQQVQVDQHPDGTEAGGFKHRKATKLDGDEVIDPDKPVYGHIDDDGNVHASNEPPATGEFVEDPQAVTDMAEANQLPEQKAPSSQVDGH